jgi:glycerophosphoryl diester phosphodiesterase
MNKIFIFLVHYFLVVSMHGNAQDFGPSDVYLTNYTMMKGQSAIGFVKWSTGEIVSVKIEGEDKGAFKIDKSYRLLVNSSKLKDKKQWYDITLKISGSLGVVSKQFRIVDDNFTRNKVIAHRGAWKNTGAPENSIAALNHAVRLGCEGSEFDVRMSADSLPVINHDPSIQGVSIAKTRAEELLKLKLANGETLPTLEDYLKAGMMQNKTKLILEIKPSELGKENSIAASRKIVTLVEKLNAQAWVDYISFDYDVCKEVMKLAPYAKVAYLNGDKTPADLVSDNFFGLDYHYNVLQKNPSWVQDAKSNKLTINVWTVNEKSMMEELLEKNVDFITTNEPELLLSIVK